MTDRPLYRYQARLIRVIDGDTVVLEIDLGFRCSIHDQHVRLFGVDTPELNGPDAMKAVDARQFTTMWFRDAPRVYIESYRDREEQDSFGRILARVYREGDPVSLNDRLLAAGKAVQR
jgi:micrococcal nuclease